MKLFFYCCCFLCCSIGVVGQKKPDLTGDWLLPAFEGLPLPLLEMRLEMFLEDYYVGSLEGGKEPLSLYKIKRVATPRALFLDLTKLGKQKPGHHFWQVVEVWEDSVRVAFLYNEGMELGAQDRMDKEGQLAVLDTTAIDFALNYGVLKATYNEEGERTVFSTPKRVVYLKDNPALFVYLVQKYGQQSFSRKSYATFYRWNYFTWDKVNALKSKDIIKMTYLDRREVKAIFATASIDSLLFFEKSIATKEKVEEQKKKLSSYHLTPAHAFSFMKGTNYLILHFKNGERIKVQTDHSGHGWYEVSNDRWYYQERNLTW